MKKKVYGSWSVVGGLAALCLSCSLAFAQPLSSQELINNAKQYDGKTVTYTGEVIGDIMIRGNYAWVNLNDGNNAIGIWMPEAFTKALDYSGSYKARGDLIEVSGIFNRACTEHGGDLDIHAQMVRKISPGGDIKENLSMDKKNLALILLGVLILIWILSLFKKK